MTLFRPFGVLYMTLADYKCLDPLVCAIYDLS